MNPFKTYHNLKYLKLMLVTQKQDHKESEYLDWLRMCCQSGVTSIQLREKNMPFEDLAKFGRKLKEVVSEFSVPLFVNDSIDLALEVNADGLHLGQSDGCVFTARKMLGPSKLIGLSVDALEHIQRANEMPIDYVGVGAIFPTPNKVDVAKIWGIEGLALASKSSRHPIIAIGGINTMTASDVIKAGAHGVAVIGAIHNALNADKEIKALRKLVD
ncbi:MAG: thiamine-phosphate diphosphorylase [Alphaproteobacteria bacterium 43-37]|nr:MAG: thiamine-phosphate diphosphorylase [Alphaproteobacteria bacterium 43-37]